ncbi:hypothetical protein ACS3UN_01600 [Oscillospiraceae bacterium LTW-04]|nr:hypothetical protein RBH76_08860 [Oscillospiraceae bacterium MB24-C1]
MRLSKKGMALILASMLMMGCSREAFKDSLNRDLSSQGNSGAENISSSQSSEALVFDMDVGEMSEDGVYLYYALPRALDPAAEEAADHISEKIHTALFSLRDEIAGDKGVHQLTVYDALTRNDGVYYSTIYDIEYLQAKDAAKEIYKFGLTFDSATGDLVDIGSIIDVNALVVLLLDEQSSKILEKEESLLAKQRAYLNEQGLETLKDRLTYPDGVVSLERLLDASFYLDGSKLIAAFAAPQDIGGVVRISVSL